MNDEQREAELAKKRQQLGEAKRRTDEIRALHEEQEEELLRSQNEPPPVPIHADTPPTSGSGEG
jgi:hypothetical protein